ncbi:MAG TPA: hypothetical protein VFZ48_04140 [Candidatus Saccharimonadales bacterium]
MLKKTFGLAEVLHAMTGRELPGDPRKDHGLASFLLASARAAQVDDAHTKCREIIVGEYPGLAGLQQPLDSQFQAADPASVRLYVSVWLEAQRERFGDSFEFSAK